MIYLILGLHTATIGAGLLYWFLESKRRREAEDAIFAELKKVLDIANNDLQAQEKIVAYIGQREKGHKFHRQLIDANIKRLNRQDADFGKFGEFIAMLAENIGPKDAKSVAIRKNRIETLKRNFWRA